MNYYVGCDLGTSSMKLLLLDGCGAVIASVSKEYPVSYPKPGWSEQDAELYYDAFMSLMPKLLEGKDPSCVRGIGVAGQMHGLVALDKCGKPLRPVILWNDGRTQPQSDRLNSDFGTEKLIEYTANISYAGFTLPKLLWMRENESELFLKIRSILLPKDYLNYRLTGVMSTDPSDASGMLLYNVKDKKWSPEMLAVAGISEDMLPHVSESGEIVGRLLPSVADALGLSREVFVIAGAGDNAAAAIGTATVGNGKCNISLGTSGTVFISSDRFCAPKDAALHSFAHADGGYHLMGCMLSCASCNKWFIEDILNTKDYTEEFGAIGEDMLGNSRVYFLPYLMGERSPLNDTDVRGTFIGLDASVTRREMLLAVIEGVCFALRDNLEVAEAMGININESTVSGGGARSPIFLRVLSSVLGIDLLLPKTEQGPAYGMGILAATAAGEYENITAAVRATVRYKERITPDAALVSRYAEKYEKFKLIYPAVRELYKKIK